MSTVWLLGAGVLLLPARPSSALARLTGRVARDRAVQQAPRRPSIPRAVLARRPAVAVAAAGTAGAAVLAGAALAVAVSAALVATVIVGEVVSAALRRRDIADQRSVTAAIEVLAAELAAGSRESASLRAAADAGGSVARCLAHAARLGEAGADPAVAFTGPFAALAGAWQVRAFCGTPLAHVVASVGKDLAARAQRRRALDSALAGPRASGAMLAALPVLGLVLGAAMGARPLSFLLGAGPGCLVLLAGVGLEACGWCFISLLVRRASR